MTAAAASAGTAAREVELSLVITAADAEALFRRLADVREVGDYVLRPRPAERIVDRYFDTADATLRKRGLALRLRTVKGSTVIGLKGPRRSASTRTEDRFEREQPFSSETVEEIGKRAGLRTSPSSDGAGPADDVLQAALGVSLIQRRVTVRRLRDVALPASADVLAEFALDRVQFEFGGVRVRHFEVEIEAKVAVQGAKAAKAIAAELVSRHPDKLIPWPYGKLPTGMAIEALISQKKLAAEGALTREAYDAVKRYLDAHDR